MKIGTNIKKLRAEKNITQEQLANHLHISCQAISKWENNSALPDVTHIPAIADYFDVKIGDLFQVDMSGYRNRAQRLSARYDVTGRREDYNRAQAEWDKRLTRNDLDADDYDTYGHYLCFHADKLYVQAEEAFEQAVALGQTGAEHMLITLRAKQDRAHESITRHEAAITADPANPEHWHKLVHAYYPVGRTFNAPNSNLTKAAEIAATALEKFPNDAFLHMLHGVILHAQNRLPNALHAWEKSIQLNPEIPDNYFATAKVLETLNRPAEAIAAWERAAAFYESRNLHEHIPRCQNEANRLRNQL